MAKSDAVGGSRYHTDANRGLGRLRGLDIMRGIAVLLMVLGHSIQYGEYGDPSPIYLALNGALSTFRMPVLMMISGMMASSMRNRPLGDLGDRCAGLFWLYAIWMPINWVVSTELPVDQLVANAPALLSLEFFKPTTVMWFIWALTLITLSIPIAARVHRYTLIATFLFISAATFRYNISPFSYQSLMRFSLFFYIGFAFKDRLTGLYQNKFSYRTLAMMIAHIASIHLLTKLAAESLGFEILQPLERLAICVMALYSIRLTENIEMIAKPLQWIGQNTLPIYVSHMPVICVFRIAMPSFKFGYSLIIPAILSVLGVTFALGLYRVLNNPKTSWLYARPAWFGSTGLRNLQARMT